MSLPRRAAVLATAACLVAAPTLASLRTADAAPAPERAAPDTETTDPTFTRIDVDAAVDGASFTTVGSVFAGEDNIVTSGYGSLDELGRPLGGGTLQVYRPGATLEDWTKVSVFGPDEDVIFPNAATITDMDGDGDHDILLPSGHFFGTDPQAPDQRNTGAITWWENHGADQDFERHDVITDQAGSYHGVQHVDLDGDGILDLVSVSEEARNAGDLMDDVVRTEFFRGRADLTFAAPVVLAHDLGGSQPIVHDLDGDGDLDIVTSQYFHLFNNPATAASFLWLENGDTDGTLTGDDFTARTMAGFMDGAAGRGLGMGFQIRPVPDFREPGTISWIGTNHVNRCTLGGVGLNVREQVVEFVPGDDPREPWSLTTLSDPATPPPACPEDYRNYPEPEFSDAITSRFGFGQGAPGVFGYGDVDGDGDIDLAVSGDGDRRLWWIENLADGSTVLHRLTAPGQYFGQSGGGAVSDFDGDGVNEIVFSSFDQDTVAIWTPTGTVDVPVTVASKLTASPQKKTVRRGAKATWRIELTAAEGPRRTVTVTFDRAKGKDLDLGAMQLQPSGAGRFAGKLTWRPKASGTLVVRYAGTTVSEVLSDTPAQATAKVTVKKSKKKR